MTYNKLQSTLPDSRPRCQARTKTVTLMSRGPDQCSRPAVDGTFCRQHRRLKRGIAPIYREDPPRDR